jgi:phosphoribosylaminoimidazole carboxylase
MDTKVIGILGGGQLGRLLVAAAHNLLIPTVVVDPSPSCPASQLLPSPNDHIVAPFSDPDAILRLAERADIITVEIEHVGVDALKQVQQKYDGLDGRRKVEVHPDPRTIEIIQDKYTQKVHLSEQGLPLGEFVQISSEDDIKQAITTLGLPLMLKARRLAYDGRGNYLLKSADDEAIHQAVTALGAQQSLYAEKYLPFKAELAVMVVRSTTGEIKSYPAVETVQKDNICHLVWAPYPNAITSAKAQQVAEKAIDSLGGAGIFGVEMFLMPDGQVLLNEIAPRPHNSGHYTLSISPGASQFENHLRAILGLPLGSTDIGARSTAMVNLVGTDAGTTKTLDATLRSSVDRAVSISGASVFLYGKAECRKGRKMGHINVSGETRAEVERSVVAILGENVESSLAKKPLVSVVMGSDSDLPTMKLAATILKQFSIETEVTIVSAHRTTDRLVEYARSAASRGIRVIIAGAGGAAHLPGMIASITPLPVIGVPINNAGGGGAGGLGGVDALYSIVQMPRGIPVATVAINNSTNAGLLAVRILSGSVPRLVGDMQKYMKNMEETVMDKVVKIEEVGWENY